MWRYLLGGVAFVAAWLLLRGARGASEAEGGRFRSSRSEREPSRPRKMVRDPQCGTYIPQEDALALGQGGGREWFCSRNCREAWRKGAGD